MPGGGFWCHSSDTSKRKINCFTWISNLCMPPSGMYFSISIIKQLQRCFRLNVAADFSSSRQSEETSASVSIVSGGVPANDSSRATHLQHPSTNWFLLTVDDPRRWRPTVLSSYNTSVIVSFRCIVIFRVSYKSGRPFQMVARDGACRQRDGVFWWATSRETKVHHEICTRARMTIANEPTQSCNRWRVFEATHGLALYSNDS